MFKITTFSHHTKTVACGVCAVALVAGIAGSTLGIAHADAAAREIYNTNDTGLTYGSPLDPETGEEYAIGPDLVFAKATNGADGYIYQSDVNQSFSQLTTLNDEELQERNNEITKAFVVAADDILGPNIVSFDDAQTYLAARQSTIDTAQADLNLVKAIQCNTEALSFNKTNATEATSAQTISIGTIQDILKATKAATATYINVYEADGKTIVGQYPIYAL